MMVIGMTVFEIPLLCFCLTKVVYSLERRGATNMTNCSVLFCSLALTGVPGPKIQNTIIWTSVCQTPKVILQDSDQVITHLTQ